jgi:hypothetical protein
MHILKARTEDGTYKYALTRVCLALSFLTFFITWAIALYDVKMDASRDMSGYDSIFSYITPVMLLFSSYIAVKTGIKKVKTNENKNENNI